MFGQVMRCLRGVQPLKGEDAVAASVRKMSNQEADDCAALIVEIFGMIGRDHVTAHRPSAWCNCTASTALRSNTMPRY